MNHARFHRASKVDRRRVLHLVLVDDRDLKIDSARHLRERREDAAEATPQAVRRE